MPGMVFVLHLRSWQRSEILRDFSSPNKLAAYCGPVPSVYQSAGKLINGQRNEKMNFILFEMSDLIILIL
jgi:transposase